MEALASAAWVLQSLSLLCFGLAPVDVSPHSVHLAAGEMRLAWRRQQALLVWLAKRVFAHRLRKAHSAQALSSPDLRYLQWPLEESVLFVARLVRYVRYHQALVNLMLAYFLSCPSYPPLHARGEMAGEPDAPG